MLDFSLAENELSSWNTDIPPVHSKWNYSIKHQNYPQDLLYTKASSESKSRRSDNPWNIFIFRKMYLKEWTSVKLSSNSSCYLAFYKKNKLALTKRQIPKAIPSRGLLLSLDINLRLAWRQDYKFNDGKIEKWNKECKSQII